MADALKLKLEEVGGRMVRVRSQVHQATSSTSWMDQANHAKLALLEIETAMAGMMGVLNDLVEDRRNA